MIESERVEVNMFAASFWSEKRERGDEPVFMNIESNTYFAIKHRSRTLSLRDVFIYHLGILELTTISHWQIQMSEFPANIHFTSF